MIFARIGHGPCYYHWNEIFASVTCLFLKLSQNKKDLNDVTATLSSVSFAQLPAAKKDTKNGAAATSLRSFLFLDNLKINIELINPILNLLTFTL